MHEYYSYLGTILNFQAGVMGLKREEIERRMDDFMEVCRREGIKLTHQRIEVFREAASSEEHPDAETIYNRIRTRLPTVSLDTVYRTLYLLEKLNLLSRVNILCERIRFDANMAPHHHFLCSRCGLLRDFTASGLENFQIPAEVQSWGDVDTIHVELRGICSECAGSNISANPDTQKTGISNTGEGAKDQSGGMEDFHVKI